jgi:nifR3 family TIM-barrel protein
MDSPETIMQIVRSLRKVLTIPLTVKMRSGAKCRPRAFLELGPMLEKEGVDAICLHPRTREQIFQGMADWRLIGELKECVNIPVIGNGDVKTGTDARKMREETHCDGIMIGRGALGNPWLFTESQAALGEVPPDGAPPDTFRDRITLALRHLEQMIQRKGEHTGLVEFRKHCVYYLRGYPGAREIRSEFFRLNRYEEAKEFLTRIADDWVG